MSSVSLKDVGYVESSNEDLNYSMNNLVDDIVDYLVSKNAKLITDTEKGIIPLDVLEQQVTNYIDINKISLGQANRKELIISVKNYLFGYGPIQELINDKSISDVKLINKNVVRIKRKGKRFTTKIKFSSEKSYRTFISYLCVKNGGSLSERNAIQILSDSKSNKDFLMRLTICLNPVNYLSPSVAIRKVARDKPLFDKLYEEGMFNRDMQQYLTEAIEAGFKIIFCGKGASGKTTLMNAGIEKIPQERSALVLQESIELHSQHPDIIFQKIKYKSGESDIEYTLQDLTINGLLMDLDYIIISETKGKEALSLFNAGYTGHIIWTSVHSDDSESAPNKLVHYMKESGTDYSRAELLEMISHIDLIVYMKDFKCAEITEVEGFDYINNNIKFNNIFKFNALKGSFERTNESCEKIKNKFKYR